MWQIVLVPDSAYICQCPSGYQEIVVSPCECLPDQHDQTVFALLQVYNQSAGDGAISTVKAATDPSLEGQGFKYFGPFYKGPLIIHTGNESE